MTGALRTTGERNLGSYAGLRMVHVRDFEPAEVLSAADRDAYCRRFATLFVDESRTRRGGLGRVSYVTNAFGESFALKTLILPEADESDESDESVEAATRAATPASDRRADMLRAAFDQEYSCHRALSGFKGFPRLYGRGVVGGVPAIIMEWIEGDTLASARRRLAVDDAGRLAPLTAARIGRDLFDLLCRMDLVGDGFVHRDISPANVMVRTRRLSIEEQAEEGAFDLCLIDFGSSLLDAPAPGATEGTHASFTTAFSVTRKATDAYAPPEMLSDDLPNLVELRRSPSVDIYEAAGVVYELLGGEPPFAAGRAQIGRPGGASSLYRLKVDSKPAHPASAHAPGAQMQQVLLHEPEVALASGQVALELGVDPDSDELRSALALVDDQFAEILLTCLVPKQAARPTAEAVRDALAAFCAHYAQNAGRALRGEPLIPCTDEGSWAASASPLATRRIIRSVGSAVSAGIWVVVVAATAVLLSGARASFSLGDIYWQGRFSAAAVVIALALPAVCGRVVRGHRTCSQTGFLQGTAALVVATAVVAGLASCLAFDPVTRLKGVYAALFASFAAAWCPFVLDYACTVVPALVREARRRLPAGEQAATPDGLSAGAPLPLSQAPGDAGEGPATEPATSLLADAAADTPVLEFDELDAGLDAEKGEDVDVEHE